jgi:hypothetical protein
MAGVTRKARPGRGGTSEGNLLLGGLSPPLSEDLLDDLDETGRGENRRQPTSLDALERIGDVTGEGGDVASFLPTPQPIGLPRRSKPAARRWSSAPASMQR